MVIQHNLSSLYTQRQLGITSVNKNKSTERLSSGYKINRASDDAAGLSISEKMRWQIRGLNKASKNIQDGISFIQVTDGALNEVHSIIQRMNELCVQASNDTNTEHDRQAIQDEIDSLSKETERIFTDTTFNTLNVFGRNLDYTQYTDSTQSAVVDKGSVQIEGNHYGIVEVLGAGHITTASNLADTVTIHGSGWVTSGNIDPSFTIQNYSYTYDSLGNIENTSTSSRTVNDHAAPGFGAVIWNNLTDNGNGTWHSPETGKNYTKSGNSLILNETVTDSNNVTKKYTTRLSYIDCNGNMLLHTGVQEIYGEFPDGSWKKTGQENILYYSNAGAGESYREGTTYACAEIDFSEMGTTYSKEDLYNLGFASTCSHGCGRYYSVQFVDNSNGEYNLDKTTANGINYTEKHGSSYVIQMDISSLSDDATGAANMVAAIVDATKTSSTFDNHWEQYAFNSSNPAKLYLYENTPYISSGSRSTWEPAARDEQGQITDLNYTTNKGSKEYIENNELNIQSTARGFESIKIKRPVMSNLILGIDTVNVLDHDYATSSIATVNKALEYVSGQRSYLGAMQNRLEHAMSIDDINSENTQASESRLRDTDMSFEMVELSKHNILEQVGSSMLSQANQSAMNVLQLLQ